MERTASDCAALACATLATRYACRSRFLYDIDSVNFALGMEHFAPALHQPHPPGYYLYVWTARAIDTVLHDANASLVAMSIVASAAAVVFIYLLAREWFGREAALFAGAIFLFSPLCWFHGTVALTYIVETFFSALVGYLCWRGYPVPAAVALGLAAGFRPSSLIFLGPLWLLSLWKAAWPKRFAAAAALAATLLAWGIPMLRAAGGAAAYLAPLWNLWNTVPAHQGSAAGWPAMLLARAVTITAIGGLCFGAAGFFLFRPARAAVPNLRVFTLVWIAPGLAFFSLIFLLFVNSGYLLVLSPPLFAWLGFRASSWRGRNLALGAAAAVNTCIFLFAPLYCSFREVRRFEAGLTLVTAAVRRDFHPAETMIVGFDSHFLGYRHAAYYLPEFLTVQFPAVHTADGPRIFAVLHRRTELLRDLPAGPYHRFVLFPLPEGANYAEYENRQRARFPRGALRAEDALLSGRLPDLHYLFRE